MSRRSILTMAAAGMTIMSLTACGIVEDSRETSSIFGAVTEFASELKDGVFQEIRRRLPGAGEDSGGGTAQEGGTEKDPEDRQQEKLAELGQETLTVEEGEIRMESETEGEADLVVRLPASGLRGSVSGGSECRRSGCVSGECTGEWRL